jgi:hypothetical protein
LIGNERVGIRRSPETSNDGTPIESTGEWQSDRRENRFADSSPPPAEFDSYGARDIGVGLQSKKLGKSEHFTDPVLIVKFPVVDTDDDVAPEPTPRTRIRLRRWHHPKLRKKSRERKLTEGSVMEQGEGHGGVASAGAGVVREQR